MLSSWPALTSSPSNQLEMTILRPLESDSLGQAPKISFHLPSRWFWWWSLKFEGHCLWNDWPFVVYSIGVESRFFWYLEFHSNIVSVDCFLIQSSRSQVETCTEPVTLPGPGPGPSTCSRKTSPRWTAPVKRADLSGMESLTPLTSCSTRRQEGNRVPDLGGGG